MFSVLVNVFCHSEQVSSELKEVVCNVYPYFKEQSIKSGVSIGSLSPTADATGLS